MEKAWHSREKTMSKSCWKIMFEESAFEGDGGLPEPKLRPTPASAVTKRYMRVRYWKKFCRKVSISRKMVRVNFGVRG